MNSLTAVAAAYQAGEETGEDRPGLRLRSLEDILKDPETSQAPEAIARGFCYSGRTSLFAAREKAGKSTKASAIAAAVSAGTDFLGDRCKQGAVLWVSVEEHPGDLARRLKAFGASAPDVYVLEYPDRPLGDVEEAVRQVRPVLVVIDTLPTFVAGVVTDSRSSSDWTPVMVRLTRIARESGAAFLLLHHSRKSDNAYRDSTAIGAGVDIILEMRECEIDPMVRRFKVRARWAIPDFSTRFHDDHFSLDAGELGVETRVAVFIGEHPLCSAKAVRDAVGGRVHAVDDAVQLLIRNGAVVDDGNASRHAYRCPETTRPDLSQETVRDEVRDDLVVPA